MTSPVRIKNVSARIADNRIGVLLTLDAGDGAEPAIFELPLDTLGELTATLTRLDRDIIDAMSRYRAERGLTTWDATVESLLAAVDVRVP